MIKNLKKKKGFTLIELIIVIAIIGILAAIAVPKFGDIQNNSRKKSDVATAKTIADATTVLITEGKIDTSSTTITGSTVYHYTSEGTTSGTATEDLIVQKLQNSTQLPQTKGYVDFAVKITSSGDVTVYASKTVATAPTDTTADQLYPVAGSHFQ